MYGDRADEFINLDTTGSVIKFYEDCYTKLINDGKEEELSVEILELLERFEVE